MDYSKMSDFEINLSVAHIVIGSGGYDWSSDKKEVYLAAMDGGEFLPNTYFDPCNNPADAWPIIHQNLIALRPVAMYVGGHRWFATKGDTDFGIKSANDNPLRAAMEVFLKMQESK